MGMIENQVDRTLAPEFVDYLSKKIFKEVKEMALDFGERNPEREDYAARYYYSEVMRQLTDSIVKMSRKKIASEIDIASELAEIAKELGEL